MSNDDTKETGDTSGTTQSVQSTNTDGQQDTGTGESTNQEGTNLDQGQGGGDAGVASTTGTDTSGGTGESTGGDSAATGSTGTVQAPSESNDSAGQEGAAVTLSPEAVTTVSEAVNGMPAEDPTSAALAADKLVVLSTAALEDNAAYEVVQDVAIHVVTANPAFDSVANEQVTAAVSAVLTAPVATVTDTAALTDTILAAVAAAPTVNGDAGAVASGQVLDLLGTIHGAPIEDSALQDRVAVAVTGNPDATFLDQNRGLIGTASQETKVETPADQGGGTDASGAEDEIVDDPEPVKQNLPQGDNLGAQDNSTTETKVVRQEDVKPIPQPEKVVPVTHEKASAIVTPNMSAIAVGLLGDLDNYIEEMNPKKAVTSQKGPVFQTRLFRIIQRTINELEDDFQPVFAELLNKFNQYSNNSEVFHPLAVFRYAESIALDERHRSVNRALLNLLTKTAHPGARQAALKQLDIDLALTDPVINEAGRQRVKAFFNL